MSADSLPILTTEEIELLRLIRSLQGTASDRKQVGGNHYAMAIEPVTYCQLNNITFCAANAIKYLSRFDKLPYEAARKSLEKAADYIRREIALLDAKHGGNKAT